MVGGITSGFVFAQIQKHWKPLVGAGIILSVSLLATSRLGEKDQTSGYLPVSEEEEPTSMYHLQPAKSQPTNPLPLFSKALREFAVVNALQDTKISAIWEKSKLEEMFLSPHEAIGSLYTFRDQCEKVSSVQGAQKLINMLSPIRTYEHILYDTLVLTDQVEKKKKLIEDVKWAAAEIAFHSLPTSAHYNNNYTDTYALLNSPKKSIKSLQVQSSISPILSKALSQLANFNKQVDQIEIDQIPTIEPVYQDNESVEHLNNAIRIFEELIATSDQNSSSI